MIRFYLCGQVGTGTKFDPLRPAISQLAIQWDRGGTEWYDSEDDPARKFHVCIVHGSQQTHDLCMTVAVPLTPTVAADADAANADLDSNVESGNAAWRDALKAALEARNISSAWINPSTTPRDVLRHIFRVIFLSQWAEGANATRVLQFLAANLDTQIGDLSAQVRNAAKNWIEARGLDTAWMVNSTTVRQVVQYVLSGIQWGPLKSWGFDL